MDSRDKIIERARKLLALADRNANEHEAALAAAKAHALLADHDLNITCVEEAQVSSSDLRQVDVMEAGSVATWKKELATGIAASFKVGAMQTTSYVEDEYGDLMRRKVLSFVGLEADTILARETFVYLAGVVDRLAKRHAGGMGKAYSTSFRIGCATRLSARLREWARRVQADLEAAGRSTAAGRELVVCKDRLIDEWRAQRGTVYWRNNPTSSDGYYAGKDAAEDVNLSHQVPHQEPQSIA